MKKLLSSRFSRLGAMAAVAGVLALGVWTPAQAESVRLGADYWKLESTVSFPGTTPGDQFIAGAAATVRGSVSILPNLVTELQYATAPGLAGQQDNQKFSVDSSQLLVNASYLVLNQGALKVGPSVGYLTADNGFIWGSGASAVKYNVRSSGLLVGGRAIVTLTPGLTVQAQALYGPRVTVKDDSGKTPPEYTSTYVDLQGAVSYAIWSGINLEAGYRQMMQTAKKDSAELWAQRSGGLFAGVRIEF
ncbi:MAG: hypothetical protein IMX01_07540 [Limnochordaceae bacterium]|nr:hypothetical protein [Limnochordaceae bacterium]